MSDVYSVKQVAAYLGLSESKVRQLVKRNAIPYVKLDGSYRFYLPTVQDWLRRLTVQPTGETEHAQTIANRIWETTEGV